MPPKKSNNKLAGNSKKGKGGKPKGGEGPTPADVIRAITSSLAEETKKPTPLPASAKRSEFKDSGRMKRLRDLPTRRSLNPKTTTLLRNDRTSYKEANSAYMRGEDVDAMCDQCTNGDGTMPSCVVVAGEFGGACTNCAYDAGGKKCSFWRAPAKKGKKGKKADSGEEEEDEDEDEDEDEGGQDGGAFWDDEEDDDDAGVGGDDGDANSLFVPHAVSAY